jgi:hypothetical protein
MQGGISGNYEIFVGGSGFYYDPCGIISDFKIANIFTTGSAGYFLMSPGTSTLLFFIINRF